MGVKDEYRSRQLPGMGRGGIWGGRGRGERIKLQTTPWGVWVEGGGGGGGGERCGENLVCK